jgi:hypothetical protein
MECRIIFQLVCIFITGYFVGRIAQQYRQLKQLRDEICSLLGRFECELQEVRNTVFKRDKLD